MSECFQIFFFLCFSLKVDTKQIYPWQFGRFYFSPLCLCFLPNLWLRFWWFILLNCSCNISMLLWGSLFFSICRQCLMGHLYHIHTFCLLWQNQPLKTWFWTTFIPVRRCQWAISYWFPRVKNLSIAMTFNFLLDIGAFRMTQLSMRGISTWPGCLWGSQ